MSLNGESGPRSAPREWAEVTRLQYQLFGRLSSARHRTLWHDYVDGLRLFLDGYLSRVEFGVVVERCLSPKDYALHNKLLMAMLRAYTMEEEQQQKRCNGVKRPAVMAIKTDGITEPERDNAGLAKLEAIECRARPLMYRELDRGTSPHTKIREHQRKSNGQLDGANQGREFDEEPPCRKRKRMRLPGYEVLDALFAEEETKISSAGIRLMIVACQERAKQILRASATLRRADKNCNLYSTDVVEKLVKKVPTKVQTPTGVTDIQTGKANKTESSKSASKGVNNVVSKESKEVTNSVVVKTTAESTSGGNASENAGSGNGHEASVAKTSEVVGDQAKSVARSEEPHSLSSTKAEDSTATQSKNCTSSATAVTSAKTTLPSTTTTLSITTTSSLTVTTALTPSSVTLTSSPASTPSTTATQAVTKAPSGNALSHVETKSPTVEQPTKSSENSKAVQQTKESQHSNVSQHSKGRTGGTSELKSASESKVNGKVVNGHNSVRKTICVAHVLQAILRESNRDRVTARLDFSLME